MYIYLINIIFITLFHTSLPRNPGPADKVPKAQSSPITQSKKEYSEFKIEYPLKEISGLALGISNKGSVYLQEDSGNKALIYVVSKQGKKLGKFELENGTNKDWEDIAVGPGPAKGKSYLYIADIGDNARKRKTISIYRLPEPTLSRDFTDENVMLKAEEIKLKYPKKAVDSEAIWIDPGTRDIYLITKEKEKCSIYKADYPQSTSSVTELEEVGKAQINRVTSGGISSDGKHLVLKNLETIYYWKIKKNEDLISVLETKPKKLPYAEEPQGEAFCFDGLNGYFTASELHKGKYPELRYYRFKFN